LDSKGQAKVSGPNWILLVVFSSVVQFCFVINLLCLCSMLFAKNGVGRKEWLIAKSEPSKMDVHHYAPCQEEVSGLPRL
jgi:hypothetical protein